VLRTCDDAPRSCATCWICWANSLVGANTNATGPSPLSKRGWLFMCTIAGRMYWKKMKQSGFVVLVQIYNCTAHKVQVVMGRLYLLTTSRILIVL
jgi:hypothetical protein